MIIQSVLNIFTNSLKDLFKKRSDVFDVPVVNGMLEFDWSLWLASKKLVNIFYIYILFF